MIYPPVALRISLNTFSEGVPLTFCIIKKEKLDKIKSDCVTITRVVLSLFSVVKFRIRSKFI